jgi:hypothetical protein
LLSLDGNIQNTSAERAENKINIEIQKLLYILIFKLTAGCCYDVLE